jgi:putative DNA primase/helicase
VPDAETLKSIALLAGYDELTYGQHRKPAAKYLGISVALLDDLVDKHRTDAATVKAQGTTDAEPTAGWLSEGLAFQPLTAPEDGAALLADLVATIRRFVFCSEHAATAEAAWVMLTWMQEHLDLLPRLGGMAPAMRCGKTRNQEVLFHLAFNPINAANLSTSVLFRIVAKGAASLFLDEVDTWLTGRGTNEETIGIINAGHSRTGRAWRTNPDTFEPESFPCFAAAALAGIGRLPPTIADRSIPVLLKRKLAGEQADKLKRREKQSMTPLRARIHRWITDNATAIADRIQSGKCIIDLGNDRAEENWEPLFALADQAGGDWPAKMREAAKALEAHTSEEGGDHLLMDIREVIAANPTPSSTFGQSGYPGTGALVQGGKVPVATLAAALRQSAASSWEKLTPRGLGNMLKGFDLHSTPERFADKKQHKCYSVADLEQVFARYLNAEPKAEEEVKPDWLG